MKDETTAIRTFLERVVEICRGDVRVAALAVMGSVANGKPDRFSDIDLVIACNDEAYEWMLEERRQFAAGLGDLLSAFTGEHVGEPRLLICLYDHPVLHVDLKFQTVHDFAHTVETPLVLFDRNGCVADVIRNAVVEWPSRSPEWFEERFWIWVHYCAVKIARGEIFEALDMLAFLRAQVLGPMIARGFHLRQRGVRGIEFDSPQTVQELKRSVAAYDQSDCWRALSDCVALYRKLRGAYPPTNFDPRAEKAVSDFVVSTREQSSVNLLHTQY